MTAKVYYHDGETEVRLGDLVETRVLLFWRSEGRVVYVPGISPKHREMEIEGVADVGIRTKDCGIIGITVIPETNALTKNVKFISRDPDGDFEEVMPDEELFESEDGSPL